MFSMFSSHDAYQVNLPWPAITMPPATAKSVLRLIDVQIDRLEEQPDASGSQAASLRALRLDEIEGFMSELAARHSDRAPELEQIQDSIDSHRERILSL